jgi:hypothetical protein
MNISAKSFHTTSSILLILFQVMIGLLGFVISGKMSQSSWLINMLFLWLGVTIGMYLGGVPFFFQASFNPKKSFERLISTALGAFLPVFVLILLGIGLGVHNSIYHALAPILAFLALALGLLGFYIPGWISKKSISA